MSYGVKILNPSGNVCFDSSKIGGVILSTELLTFIPNQTIIRQYTIPAGRSILNTIFPQTLNFNSSAISNRTITYSGTIATLSLTSQANISIFIMVLLT
jgi:hypothetical protein